MTNYLDLSGMVCGASRWPFFNSHPDGWGRPLKGTGLAPDAASPTQQAVDQHIASLEEIYRTNSLLKGHRPFQGRVPVLWEFGTVLWETLDKIRSYEDDIVAWKTAHANALALEQARISRRAA